MQNTKESSTMDSESLKNLIISEANHHALKNI
jgi:hypothetical protein